MAERDREEAQRGPFRARQYDAVIVGAGPNGLSAAVALARAGLSVLVVEAADTPGGGTRTKEVTLPGFAHDICSTVHPLGIGSPYFRTLPLGEHGLSWVEAPSELAHVLDDGSAVLLERSLDRTARGLGSDGQAYQDLLGPFVERFHELMSATLGPLRVPSSPLLLARFGLTALRPLRDVCRARFNDHRAPALLAGIAAHAMLPLDALGTTSFGLVLGTAGHAVGWPVARGGSRAITDALLSYLRTLGGELVVNFRVDHLDQLPQARAYLLDVTPRQLLQIAQGRLPSSYARRLQRFRYGPGSYKIDYALSGPIPWKDPACARAFTVHLSGTFDEVSRSEAAVHRGELSEPPFVLLVQPTLYDGTRAPEGRQIAWAYCHVPHGSRLDASRAIEAQIERHAPGFRDLVLTRTLQSAIDLERYNLNYIGGDINGGLSDITQLLFRPVMRLDPYSVPGANLFLCSSSTPPGGGVHGMCGFWAAQSALTRVFGKASTSGLPA